MSRDEGLTATVIGLDRLKRNLDNLTGPPLAELLTGASSHAKKVAAEGVGGVAANSMMSEVRPGSARVFSLMASARTRSLEEGRRPGGALLHPDALQRWIRRVEYGLSPYVLAKQIQRRGVKGRFFMKAAVQSTQELLPGLIRDMARAVEGRFGRR